MKIKVVAQLDNIAAMGGLNFERSIMDTSRSIHLTGFKGKKSRFLFLCSITEPVVMICKGWRMVGVFFCFPFLCLPSFFTCFLFLFHDNSFAFFFFCIYSSANLFCDYFLLIIFPDSHYATPLHILHQFNLINFMLVPDILPPLISITLMTSVCI